MNIHLQSALDSNSSQIVHKEEDATQNPPFNDITLRIGNRNQPKLKIKP